MDSAGCIGGNQGGNLGSHIQTLVNTHSRVPEGTKVGISNRSALAKSMGLGWTRTSSTPTDLTNNFPLGLLVQKITEPSVKSLLIKMQFDGHLLATGTGFIAPSPKGAVLVTNLHNVTGRDPLTNQPLHSSGGIPNEVAIVHNRLGRLGEWIEKIEPLTKNDRRLWHLHPVLGEQADFVALLLTDLEDVQLFPYDPSAPGTDIAIGPADSLSVVGFPFGKAAGGSFAIWATGFMASEASVDYNGLPMFLIDCRSRQGQSGSPVIAYRSGGMVAMSDGSSAAFSGPAIRFLGIYSGRINSESDLGMVWKASAILELLEEI